MRHPAFATAMMAALAVAPAHAAAAVAASSEVERVAEQEDRLNQIAWRLAIGSAGWCPHRVAQPGWLLSDSRRFSKTEWPQAAAFYGADADGPFIAAIAPGSAAAQAGLKRGDRITAINGQPVTTSGDSSVIRIDTATMMLMQADPDQPATVTDGAGKVHRLPASPGCASAFRIERSGVPAAANGQLVRVRWDIARSITDEAQLASVVAHEMAHNLLKHRARLAATKDKSDRLVRLTELEADRLAVWLMADAGYDPAAALAFWDNFRKPLFRASTHPPRGERKAAIDAEIATMKAARAKDPLAKPVLIVAPPPLE